MNFILVLIQIHVFITRLTLEWGKHKSIDIYRFFLNYNIQLRTTYKFTKILNFIEIQNVHAFIKQVKLIESNCHIPDRQFPLNHC